MKRLTLWEWIKLLREADGPFSSRTGMDKPTGVPSWASCAPDQSTLDYMRELWKDWDVEGRRSPAMIAAEE